MLDTNEHSIEPGTDLSPSQLRAITLLIEGKKQAEAADCVGVCGKTVTRWLRENESFRTEYDRQKGAMYESLLMKARTVLDEHLDNGSRLEQWRAAQSILIHHSQMTKSGTAPVQSVSIVDRLREFLTDRADVVDGHYQAVADLTLESDLGALPDHIGDPVAGFFGLLDATKAIPASPQQAGTPTTE